LFFYFFPLLSPLFSPSLFFHSFFLFSFLTFEAFEWFSFLLLPPGASYACGLKGF
jgi:hypothetical protein